MAQTLLLQGNEACAEGALYAGCRFYGGYPITPSSEIAEYLARKLPLAGGTFVQMEDEIASIASIIGASMAGVKAMTATSGPGFSLMQENLDLAAVTETPVVIVDAMRGGPSTGMPTATGQGDYMQARWGSHSDHPVVVLAPAGAQEMFDLTVKAFNIAEALRLPVVLLPEAVVSHIREAVRIPDPGEMEVIDRYQPDDYEGNGFFRRDERGLAYPPVLGSGFHPHYTGLAHAEDGFPSNDPGVVRKFVEGLNQKVAKNLDLVTDFEEEAVEDAEVILASFGVTGRACQHVARLLRKQGHRVGYFRPRIVWPFPEARVRELAHTADTFVVAELNLGQMRLEVERIACGEARVVGLHKVDGSMLEIHEILVKVNEVLP
ncbi:MAG: 2-oxoglutarate synthase subunit alpha [Planctomycetales bacterium 4484_113]|nr:MAG: 2-oxoglutarate synthase subunit alpha [Planctomycetales bacterium 4484_113]